MARRKPSTKFTDPVKREHNPRYSSLLMQQEIELSSNEAQSLLGHFQRANIALYHLGASLPRRITAEQTAELKRVVCDAICQLEENQQSEYARVNLLHKECGQNTDISFSSKPLKTSVDLAHPDSKRLLDLLVGFDQMHRQLAELWFAMQIGDGVYVRVGTNCRNVLKEGLKIINRLVRQAAARNETAKHPQNTRNK